MASATPKSKPKLTYSGFDYVFQTKRKDGSETWRCVYKDCEARILKKTEGGKDALQALKDHSVEVELSNSAAVHLTLNCIKQRALKNPEEPTKDTIRHALDAAKELIIASMPSASTIEEFIKNWRTEQTAGGGKTPRRRGNKENKENTPENGGRKVKIPRKRAKLAEDTKGNISNSEAKESPARTSPKKRSRSSKALKYVDTDSEEELEIELDDKDEEEEEEEEDDELDED